MQVFATMSERMNATEAVEHARRVEAMGYDGLMVPEAVHDGFLTSMAALTATERLRVTTSVLVVFPRSPMVVAHAAWDLQALSRGRFELGLGTQVRGNIVGRFSTEWTSPVPRMREYIESLKAIFHSFQTGQQLAYEGDHYHFTRLQDFFNPGPLETDAPPILLGAVGPDMTRMAGGTADGLMTHPTNSSPRYIRDVTLPRVTEGAARKNRPVEACPVVAAGMVATGVDEAAVREKREWVREHFSFLYSTPAYWPSLEYHGWGDVGRQLHACTKEGRWGEMKALMTDEIIDTLVPQGTYSEIAQILLDGFGPIVERITFPLPDDPALDGEAAKVVAKLRAAPST
jgi:probable F420-dependent oxidoreductase